MRIKIAWALLGLTLSAVPLSAQWTDRNNTQKSAAYMLQLSYNERGYLGVRVDVTKQDGKDVFVVQPGPLYHVKELHIADLSASEWQAILPDAPKVGDVYSAARVNEWIKDANKQLHDLGRTDRLSWGVHFDHEHAQVLLRVRILPESPQ